MPPKLPSSERRRRRFRKPLLEPTFLPRIPLRCHSLDTLLGGGLPFGKGITEIYGASGTGKTQICLQMVVSTVNMGYQCAWINTEKRFPIQRLVQIAPSVDLLNSVWVAEVKDLNTAQLYIQRDLQLLVNHRNIALLVIDSVAGLFRTVFECYKTRSGALRKFHDALDRFSIPILLTNQAMSLMDEQETRGMIGETIKPCLGPLWAELITTRLLSSKGFGGNTLKCIYSPYIRSGAMAKFVIDSNGLETAGE